MAGADRASTLLKAYDKAWRRVADADVEMAWVGSFTEEAAEATRKEHKAAHANLAKVQESTRAELRVLLEKEDSTCS